MQLSDNELDYTLNKVSDIEKEIIIIQEQLAFITVNIDRQIESLKETQKYLIKLAQNQQELTKRIYAWPYLVVEKGE
jgi:hypothetical protein